MKSYPIEFLLIGMLLFMPTLVLTAYGNQLFMRLPRQPEVVMVQTAPAPQATNTQMPTSTATPTRTPHPTATATLTPTLVPTDTATFEPTHTPAEPTETPSLGEMLKTHIVFYLIQPEAGRADACGNIQTIPIISKRMRTGDKIYDVQVALNMLFSLKRKLYIQWYNALWDTALTINSYQYNAKKDYMIIDFGGYLPAGRLSNCDKHGIREQIWATFFHYGIQEKTFTIDGKFLIDQLNRKTK